MNSKSSNRVKLYLSIIIAGLIITALALTAVFSGGATQNTTDKIETETAGTTPIVFANPVLDADIIKGYSDTDLQFSKTMKQWEAHKAIDFGTTESADVYCVYDGTVESISSTYLMGTTVVINHGNNLKSIYSSLNIDDVEIKEGDAVKKGQVIGKTSTSAQSESADGNHLHFEVKFNNKNVDPNLYLNLENK